MTARGALRLAFVWLGRIALALGAVLALVLLALVVMLGTPPGRQWLLARGLAVAGEALPGKLVVARLERASPYGVTLAGVSVRDPADVEVLRLARIEIEIEPWPLARGRIVVPRVLVADGFVELRDIEQRDRGLLAAFVDPNAPPAPPSEAPPPYLEIGAIELRGISIRGPDTPPLGAVNVVDLALRASFELDAKPRAVLRSLSAELERDGERLGRVERLSGVLGRGAEASEVALEAEIVGAKIELSARGVLPQNEGFRSAPLAAQLAVRGVNARAISGLLRDKALESAFAGDAGIELAASGTPDELSVRATIASAGGPIALDARIQNLDRAELDVSAERFEPWRVRAELPEKVVTLSLRAEANAADRSRIPFSVQIPSSSFGGEPLPALTLEARFEQDAFRAIDLRLMQGESSLRVSGEASLAGAVGLDVQARLTAPTLARLTRLVPQGPKLGGPITADLRVERSLDERVRLTGELSASSIAVGETALEHLHASFDIAGPLLNGQLSVDLRGLTLSGQRVRHAKLEVHGSGRQYRLNAEATHDEARAALALDLELAGDEVTLRGKIRGDLRGEPFELAIAPTRVRAGSVVTQGLALRVAEQELEVRGSLTAARSELVLETSVLDLEALGKLAALPEKLSGTATVRADMSGTLAAPRLALTVEGSGASFGQRPPLDARLSASLDAAAGHAELDLTAESNDPAKVAKSLSLTLSAKHRFAGGKRWLAALEAGEADIRIELPRLDLAFVEAWLGRPLGVSGSAQLSAEGRGTLAQPELLLRSRFELTPAGQRKSLTLAPRLSYTGGRIELSLPVDDASGRWLEAHAEVALGSSRGLLELARDVRAALANARWSVNATLAERELASLPIGSTDLPPAAFSARLQASGEPNREPHAELAVSVRQTKAYEALPGCRAIGTTSELAVQLQGGTLRATLGANSGQRRLFEVHANAELKLGALLAGGDVRLGRVDAGLLAQQLDLASLPLLCGRVSGTLDSDIELADVLGQRPSLEGNIQARGLSLGTTTGLDVAAKLRADHERLALDASLGTKAGTSTLRAQMPIAWSNGRLRVERDAPFELHARLDQLPISPLLDPRGAISYATGSVSGEVHADGKLSAPRARGELRLQNVAFTATSLAQPLHDIEGRLTFTERSLAIQGLRARDKDGELRLDGSVNIPAPDNIGVELHVVAERFPLRQEGQVVATTDVDARVEATVTRERTVARVTLKNVDTWIETASGISGLALDAHPEFVIDGTEPPQARRQEPASAAAAATEPVTTDAVAIADGAPSADARVTELSLDASDRFWVKRDDFAVKLATKLDARIQGSEVRVTGKVDIDRGYLSLLGKVFTLERGSHLEFVGSEAPDPIVDISASHENRRAGSTIKVQITGRGSKPVLTFFIDERAASAGDAFLAIYGNQQSNQRPGEASDQARQFVGGLAAGLLATSARRELGAAAPIIMVEPGEQTGQGRVRAGLELDSLVPKFLQSMITGVYFEGIVARESENPKQQQANVQGGALLELYFPNGFFSTGQYGPGATWSLDWGWQM